MSEMKSSSTKNNTSSLPDGELLRIQQKANASLTEKGKDGNDASTEKKPKLRERIRTYATEELSKLKKKMPGDVFQKHKSSVDALLDKFGDDAEKIEEAVKTQLREIEKQLVEKNIDVKDIIEGLKKGRKYEDMGKLVEKTNFLSDTEMKILEKTLRSDHEKRALFIACVRDCTQDTTGKNQKGEKALKVGGKLENLFGSLATVDINGIDTTVSGFNLDQMKNYFHKESESKKTKNQLSGKIDGMRSDMIPQLNKLQDSLKKNDIDGFFGMLTSIKGGLKLAIKEYDTIEFEAKASGNKEVEDNARIASAALNKLLELNPDTFTGLVSKAGQILDEKLFDGKRKKNTISELQVRCQAALVGLSGNIAFLTFEGKENSLQTAASLEASLKNGEIEKVSSVAFAEYLTKLSSVGRLNLAYLQKAIGPEALKKFGYLWRIGETNGSTVDTNAQKKLKEMGKESVKIEFEKVLIENFDTEESRFKIKNGGKFEHTKHILVTEGKFTQTELEDIISKFKESSNPYNDLVTTLARSKAKSVSEMGILVEKIAGAISQDSGNTISTTSEILKADMKSELPPGSKWKKIQDFIYEKDTKSLHSLEWNVLMGEAKNPNIGLGKIDEKDRWFFDSIYSYQDLLADKENILGAKKVLKKYEGKHLLKPEYERILIQFLNILEAQNKEKQVKDVKNSKQQQEELAKRAQLVQKEAAQKGGGKPLTYGETRAIAESINKNTKLDQRMEQIGMEEDTKKNIEKSPFDFKEKIQNILLSDNSEIAQELLEILNRSILDFQSAIISNDAYRLFFLNAISDTYGNPQIDALRKQLVYKQQTVLSRLSDRELKTYNTNYATINSQGIAMSGFQNGLPSQNSNIGGRESIMYTSGIDTKSYLESGSNISFGSTEVSQNESGELVIDMGDRTTTIDKKYASAALVSIEVANTIGFPELVQNIDFFIAEMKHDPLFERILDGANEYEEVLVAKKLASTIGLKYDDSINTPTQLYSSIENNRVLLPGAPSVQFIALQNGIISNNGRIRREVFIDRLKNPLMAPAT